MAEPETETAPLDEEEDFQETIGRFILESPPDEEEEVFKCLPFYHCSLFAIDAFSFILNSFFTSTGNYH